MRVHRNQYRFQCCIVVGQCEHSLSSSHSVNINRAWFILIDSERKSECDATRHVHKQNDVTSAPVFPLVHSEIPPLKSDPHCNSFQKVTLYLRQKSVHNTDIVKDMFLCVRRSRGEIVHQTSASTLQQLCDDASDTVLIENNGVTPEWAATYFLLTPLFSMRTESLGSLQS